MHEIVNQTVYEISHTIIDFLKQNQSELPVENKVFQSFVLQSVRYLSNVKNDKHSILQRDFLRSNLLPLEIAGKGIFKFTLDNGSDESKGFLSDPTIQITSTTGNFHALIIKISTRALDSYQKHKTIGTEVGVFQIGHVTNRLSVDIDLQVDYPELYAFKQKCIFQETPIIYILGAARQFPLLSETHARAVTWQKQSLDIIFHRAEENYANNIVFATGGWAGKIEGSLGVPRLGYLHALKSNKVILTTMPHCGAYDRHEDSTLEVFCGQEWGDDSPVLAKMSDGAFIVGAFGAWTKIEIKNLLIQNKPFVIIDCPESPQLLPGENLRRIEEEKGSYYIFRDATRAAEFLFGTIKEKNRKLEGQRNFDLN